MQETLGTLNLKIARLEQHLNVLRQQQTLSRAYPDYLAGLTRRERALQAYLNQLIVSRDLFLQYTSQSTVGRT